MSGSVHRLVTRPERMRREAGNALRDAIQAIPDDLMTPFERVTALRAAARITQPARGAQEWPGGFTMISLEQIGRVWDAIRQLPAEDRPADVRRAFDLVLLNLVPDEGRVDLTREEFAAKMGVEAKHASTALGVLVRLGVLTRQTVRVPGLRGPGLAVFHINPHVAWNGALDVRKERAAKQAGPLLQLMEGGNKSA